MVNTSDAIITRSGCMFRVRPAHADDEAALAEFFKHVTPEDMRFRFLTGVKEVESMELRENHAAIELEREMGFTAPRYPGDPTLMFLQRTLGTD